MGAGMVPVLGFLGRFLELWHPRPRSFGVEGPRSRVFSAFYGSMVPDMVPMVCFSGRIAGGVKINSGGCRQGSLGRLEALKHPEAVHSAPTRGRARPPFPLARPFFTPTHECTRGGPGAALVVYGIRDGGTGGEGRAQVQRSGGKPGPRASTSPEAPLTP